MKSEVQSEEAVQNERDEFQSISDKSSDIEEDVKQVELTCPKKYILTPINFPQFDSKTIQMFSMYQKNGNFIKNLKQQIVRLQNIKKQSAYLEQELPKTSINAQVSQFVLGCRETYDKRQLELLRLKKDIKTIDSEQVRILMAKNENIFNLAETFFKDFKRIIDVRTYEEGLILLTEEKKRNRKKKQANVQEQMNKLNLNEGSSESVENGNKVSGIRAKKVKYLIRFVNYSQIFSELGDSKSALLDKVHYMVSFSSDQVPISLAYSHKLKLVLILLKNGTIASYYLGEHDSQSSVHDNHSNHKTEHLYSKLSEIQGAKISFDARVKVIFWELRENRLYVLTSDSLLRIYEVIIKENRVERFKMVTILCCQNRQKDVGSITGMSFSKLNPQDMLFVTDKNHLCKINTVKFKSEVLYTYNEKLIQVSPFYLEDSGKIFFSTQNFDPIETKLIEKSKMFPSQNDKLNQKILKLLCLQKKDKIYVIKAEKHGLLTGVQLCLDSLSPQVEIIETQIE